MQRNVGAEIDVTVTADTTLEFQIALAYQQGARITEALTFTHEGQVLVPEEIVGEHGGRVHRFDAKVGHVHASYQGTVYGQSDPIAEGPYDRTLYLRPSRYSEADRFYGFAAKEFAHISGSADLLAAVSSFVGTRVDYIPGSSDATDGAVETLLSAAGVCRDYAHLVVALLRAMKVPARLVAVYAPGCDPMDFHAVAEALVDGQWRVVDATLLAPRSTLMRISTGRDASDTAFLDNHGGGIILNYAEVTATVEGDLPSDDITELVTLR